MGRSVTKFASGACVQGTNSSGSRQLRRSERKRSLAYYLRLRTAHATASSNRYATGGALKEQRANRRLQCFSSLSTAVLEQIVTRKTAKKLLVRFSVVLFFLQSCGRGACLSHGCVRMRTKLAPMQCRSGLQTRKPASFVGVYGLLAQKIHSR